MTIAFVFPGQGSQSIGMLASLNTLSNEVQATFAEASEVLGYDLWRLCQEGPQEALDATERTQPAMLAAGVATYRLWVAHGGALPDIVAGHSLGEFSALVVAGALDFKVAVDLVRFRAEVMQEAVPKGQGAMAAILGLEDSDVEAVCNEAAQGEVVEAVNFNSPGQVVIAGHTRAVNRGLALATARGAKRAVLLPVSVPSHSSLMLAAALRLRARLEGTPLAAANAVAFHGVDVKRLTTPTEIRAGLVKQLHTPVYWASTIRTLIGSGTHTLVECGPGKVLTSLNRRIDRSRDLKMLALEDPKSFHEALASLAAEVK
jgi:[acyl-carrier-protein] S-malonyltransferase